MRVAQWAGTGAPVCQVPSSPQPGSASPCPLSSSRRPSPVSRRGAAATQTANPHSRRSHLLASAQSPHDPAPGRPGGLTARPVAPYRRPTLPPFASAAAAGPGGGSGAAGAGSAFGDPNSLVGMLMAYAVQLQQQQQQAGVGAIGAEIRVEGIGFHPPGSEKPLLEDINLSLPANKLGLIMGRSGSGKTTLLQVLAGLTEQTSGQIRILRGGGSGGGGGAGGLPQQQQQRLAVAQNGGAAGNGTAAAAAAAVPAPLVPPGLSVEERMAQVGLVFQFPERHFLGEDLMQELTFTWPRLMQYWGERQALSARMQQVLEAVGLEDIPLNVAPWALSGGQQRRLALAIQLVRQPALLLLDEPLAGLDWTSRQEVVTLLRRLKEQCTLLVVSHDLAEIAPLVDCAWRMRIGGTCEPVDWPPADLAGLEQ